MGEKCIVQCSSTIFVASLLSCSVEEHHRRLDAARSGDNVGVNVKGLDKGHMPRAGDCMVHKASGGHAWVCR